MDQPSSSLRIDTSLSPDNLDAPSSPLSPNAPFTARERARSISQGLLPQLRLSTDKSRPSGERNAASLGMEKARNESRKLLSHILAQLEARNFPPPVLEGSDARAPQAKRGIAAVVRSIGKGKGSDAKQSREDEDSDEDYATNDVFFTDATLKLMVQLKDTLQISIFNSWDIFSADNTDIRGPGRQSSFDKPRRKRRLSSQNRSRSRSSSPNRFQDEQVQAPELLSQCISILNSVVLEDCRFRIYAPNLTKPPYTLQAVTLDVAQILIHLHRDEPRTLSQIGFAVVPAFQTFQPSMHHRLLKFFDDGVLGYMLEGLQKVQGRDVLVSPTNDSPDDAHSAPPMVSIMVEEAQDDSNVNHSATDRWRRWRQRANTQDAGHQSSTAPEQDIAVYYLSSLVEPLLSAILENVDLFQEANVVTHRFHHLFTRLTQQKPDVYLDLLGVIAYHNPKSRYAAISLLTSYWPKSVGHVVVTRPISETSSIPGAGRPDRRSSVTRRLQLAQDHPYAHQFIPWRFSPPAYPVVFEGLAPNHCRACSDSIEGFGLLCPFCMCAVHFDCYDYPDGSFFTEYSLQSDPDMQKVAVHRFCHVLPHRRGNSALTVRKEQHVFHMVNTFSMSLCCLCRKPLWGTVMQGYKCGACHLFAHAECLASSSSSLTRCRAMAVDSSSVTIPYSDLRQSFVEHYRDLLLTEADLVGATHEEISVLYAVLWTQLQILNNGVALGSVVVSKDTSSEEKIDMEEFELHYLVELYEAYLSGGRLPVSTSLMDYLAENRLQPRDNTVYFDWNTLAFIASIIKLPPSSDYPDNADANALLSVSQASGRHGGSSDEESCYPYEIASLAHIRDRMGDALGVHRDVAARRLLVHLHHLGLLERQDSRPSLFDDGMDPERMQCLFPLPFGFDITLEVETLVATIEACLSDLNLSVNEVGFLLLIRRFWPDSMLSNYSFRRLSKAILSWILSEDSNLALILREYVARNKTLPGVRSGEAQSWPTPSTVRPTATVTANNGGDYVASRRVLLNRYAAPWMLALHDLDLQAYSDILYDLLCEHAEEGGYVDPFLTEAGDATSKRQQARELEVMDKFLRSIIKISQGSVAFTAFDDLFQRWLARAQNSGICEVAIPSLPRLFTREDGSQRHSLVFEGRSSVGELAAIANVNPLHKLMDISFSSMDGYRRGLRWLCIFASSGVDIPVSAFYQFAASAGRFRADLEDCSILVKAGLYSAWLRSIGRQELQGMVGLLHEHLAATIVASLESKGSSLDALAFIRQSLAMCLLLYGCDRQYLLSLQFVKQDEIQHLPSRRKIGSRASTMTDPVIVDSKIMTAVKLYVEQGLDALSSLLAKFLNAFVNETSLVESYEVDNFILRNSTTLSACIWDFYSVQAPELSLIRGALFVRVLVVDSQPFQSLLAVHLNNENWEIRLEAVLRLFRIVSDVTSPTFVVEDRQWGPSVVEVFRRFFSVIWSDKKEEVRLAADTWSQTLLPAHFDAIARCWNDALAKAPMSERVKLVTFLAQLRSHFPSWKVLGWETMIDAMLETDFMGKNGHLGDIAAGGHLSFYGLSSREASETGEASDPDSTLLRVALASLSLRMMADSITIDLFSLLKLKDQVVRTLGYQDVSLVPSANGRTFFIQYRGLTDIAPSALPCIADLLRVLDSAQQFELSCSAMGGPDVDDETPFMLLVGSAFVDVLLDLFVHIEDAASLPPLALKNLFKSLIIVMQKHDFDSRPLRHLQVELRKALRCCLTLLLDEEQLSLELRQLALSACQIFITRWPNVMSVFIYEAIEGVVKVMISLQYEEHPEDSLVVQARTFLENVMTTFYARGILHVLFKRALPVEFFKALNTALSTKAVVAGPTSLRDALLHDTLSRAPDNEGDSYQLVLENLNSFVDVVHHSNYSRDLLQFVGASLTAIAQRFGDFQVDTFDASPLLLLSSTLIQNHKSQSRDFIQHVAAMMQLVLPKCRVSASALSQLLQVTTSLYRKAERGNGSVVPNQVASAFLDALSEILVGRNKIIPASLPPAMEVIFSNISISCIPLDRLPRLAEEGLIYLHAYNTFSPWHQDFVSCQAVAKMILQAAMQYADLLKTLENNALGVRTWNMVLLAALSLDGSECCSMLLGYFPAFVQPYYSSLEYLQAITSDHQAFGDMEPSNISRAYLSMKLWLLVVQKTYASALSPAVDGDGQSRMNTQRVRMIWNELWPPFESVVINLHENTTAANSLLLASSSVADLFLFLHQMRIAIALEPSSQVAMLNKLRSNSRLESKVIRVLRALSEPPGNVPMVSFISQIAAEISAEQKLESAKLQDSMKPIYERTRKATLATLG